MSVIMKLNSIGLPKPRSRMRVRSPNILMGVLLAANNVTSEDVDECEPSCGMLETSLPESMRNLRPVNLSKTKSRLD
mgnify:CR=1 FL=1